MMMMTIEMEPNPLYVCVCIVSNKLKRYVRLKLGEEFDLECILNDIRKQDAFMENAQ